MTHFKLEEQWQAYLTRFGIDDDLLTGMKERGLKTAFVAGIEQVFNFLVLNGAALSNEDLEQIHIDLNEFWKQVPRLAKHTLTDGFGRQVTFKIQLPENYIRDITDNP